MRFLKRMANALGLLHGNGEEGDGAGDEDQSVVRDESGRRAFVSTEAAQGVRRGFSVQVPVVVERPQVGPVLVPCDAEDGGVQGFKWYGEKLKVDDDGDVADEFLDEVLLEEAPEMGNRTVFPSFKANHSAHPAAVKKQIFVSDGNVRQGIEHRGRLQWA